MDFDSCFNCGQQGHFASNCPAGTFDAAPSYNEREASDREAHLERIKDIVTKWHDGKISLTQKQRLIVNENLAHYEGPLHGTREHLTRMPS